MCERVCAYVCVCVCACVRDCVRACVLACLPMCVCELVKNYEQHAMLVLTLRVGLAGPGNVTTDTCHIRQAKSWTLYPPYFTRSPLKGLARS